MMRIISLTLPSVCEWWGCGVEKRELPTVKEKDFRLLGERSRVAVCHWTAGPGAISALVVWGVHLTRASHVGIFTVSGLGSSPMMEISYLFSLCTGCRQGERGSHATPSHRIEALWVFLRISERNTDTPSSIKLRTPGGCAGQKSPLCSFRHSINIY